MKLKILLCLSLTLLTFGVYTQVLDHDFVNYDDPQYVTENQHVASGLSADNVAWAFTSVYASNWHPVTWLSHMADAQLYGLSPRGHHVTSVAIHCVAASLLFLLFLQLTNLAGPSFCVAALFALHPLHVESVAWVAERKDVLSACFGLLALLLYVEYLKKSKPWLYALSLVAFLMGLMSKPMLVTLPAVMLLLDYWPLERDRLPGQESSAPQVGQRRHLAAALLREKAPFLLASLLSCAVTIFAQQRGGALRDLQAVPLSLRIPNAIQSYAKYLGQTFWPHDLAVLYPIPSAISAWQVAASLLALALVSSGVFLFGRTRRYLAVGWLWFLVTLVPVIGLVQVGNQAMADRYTYLPSIGLFLMVTWGARDLARNLRRRNLVLGAVAGLVLVALASTTWSQLSYWRDSGTLFRHAVEVTDGNVIAYNNLAAHLTRIGNLDGAAEASRKALLSNPAYPAAHLSLGVVLQMKGDLNAAVAEYQEAVRLQPDSVEAHDRLGTAMVYLGRVDAGIDQYLLALRTNPDSAVLHNNLGFALEKKGDQEGAFREYQTATRLNPRNLDARNNLGTAYGNRGDFDAAIREYSAALEIDPKSEAVRGNLTTVLSLKKKAGR